MYYPYLRGKQFELYALENVNPAVFRNTLPIVEPVATNKVANGIYRRLAAASRPMILVVNPQAGPLDQPAVERDIVGGLLSSHTALTLGYIVNPRTTPAELRAFLTSSLDLPKAVIIRANFLPGTLTSLNAEIQLNSPAHLIFDSSKTSHVTQQAFAWHPHRVLITDGFQLQQRNADYPNDSVFISDYATYRANGWNGIGDYQTIGDNYRDGGGQPYVVTIHLTRKTAQGVITQHYSSVTSRTLPGDAPLKFTEACNSLVACPFVAPLSSTGITMFRNWQASGHFPALGPVKQASLQHHIELLSSLV
jgi:hypothetical protein